MSKTPISFWQNCCRRYIHNNFLNRGICLQHEAAKVRFIWRFIINLEHPASLLGQVAVKSELNGIHRGRRLLENSYSWNLERCLSKIQKLSAIQHPAIHGWFHWGMKCKCLYRRGKMQEDVEKFWWHKVDCLHFFCVYFLCMCVIKQQDDPLQLDWGLQSVTSNKANILNSFETGHWPYFWTSFYRKPSVLKSHSIVWSTQGPPAEAPC